MIIVAAFGDATFRARAHGAADTCHGIGAAARDIHALVDDGHRVVVVHGTDPSPGAGSMASGFGAVDARAHGFVPPGTATDARLEMALRGTAEDKRSFVTIVGHALVDRGDPAFVVPSRKVGPLVDATTARRLELSPSCTMLPDGTGYRRALPEPIPTRVLQSGAVRSLVSAGHTVLCGTMTVVTRDLQGRYARAEAVVDRDRAAALLAHDIGADRLLMLTDVDGVRERWPDLEEAPMHRMDASALDPERYDAGSMRPKLQAALAFADGPRHAVIGAVGQARAMVEGRAGTRVER